MYLQKMFLYYLSGLFLVGCFISLFFGTLNTSYFLFVILIWTFLFYKFFYRFFAILWKNKILFLFLFVLFLVAFYIPISDGDSLYYHYPIATAFLDKGILLVPELPKVWNADLFAYYPSLVEFFQSLFLLIFQSDVFIDAVQIIFYIFMLLNILDNFPNSKKYICIILSMPVLLLNTITGANDIVITYLFMNIFIAFWKIFLEDKLSDSHIINDATIIIILSTAFLFAVKYTAIIYLFFLFMFFGFYFIFFIKEKKNFLKHYMNSLNRFQISLVFCFSLFLALFFYVRNYIFIGNPIFPLNMIGKINYASFGQFLSQIIIDQDFYLRINYNYNYGFGVFFLPLICYLLFFNLKHPNKKSLFFLFIFLFFLAFRFLKIQTVPYHKYYIFIYLLLFLFFSDSFGSLNISKKLFYFVILLSVFNISLSFPFFGDLQEKRDNSTGFIKQIKNGFFSFNDYSFIGELFLLPGSSELYGFIQDNLRNKKILLSNPIFFQPWYNLSSLSYKNSLLFLDNYFLSNFNKSFSCTNLLEKVSSFDYFFSYFIQQKYRTFGVNNGRFFLSKINDGENRIQYKTTLPPGNYSHIKIEYGDILNAKIFLFYDGIFYPLSEDKKSITLIKKLNQNTLYFILFSQNFEKIVFDSSFRVYSVNEYEKLSFIYEKIPVESFCFSYPIRIFNEGHLYKLK